MVPSAAERNIAVGKVRGTRGVTNEKPEGMTAGAGIKVKLFSASAGALGDDAGVAGLGVSFNPGLH